MFECGVFIIFSFFVIVFRRRVDLILCVIVFCRRMDLNFAHCVRIRSISDSVVDGFYNRIVTVVVFVVTVLLLWWWFGTLEHVLVSC